MRADSPHLSSPSLTLQRLESPPPPPTLLPPPAYLIGPRTSFDVLIVLTYLHCTLLLYFYCCCTALCRTAIAPLYERSAYRRTYYVRARESVISE